MVQKKKTNTEHEQEISKIISFFNDEKIKPEILKSAIDNYFQPINIENVFGCPIEEISDYQLLQTLKDRNSWELEEYVEDQIDEESDGESDEESDEDESDIVDDMFSTNLAKKMEDLTSDELYHYMCDQLGTAPNDPQTFQRKFKAFLLKISKGLPDNQGINITEQKDSSKNQKIIVK